MQTSQAPALGGAGCTESGSSTEGAGPEVRWGLRSRSTSVGKAILGVSFRKHVVFTLQSVGTLWAPRETSGLQGPSQTVHDPSPADPRSVIMVTLVLCPQAPRGTAGNPFPRGPQSHCGHFHLRMLQRWLSVRTVRFSGVTLSKDMGVLGTRCRRVLLTVYPLD